MRLMIITALMWCLSVLLGAAEVIVARDTGQLKAALIAAQPGDQIHLMPGTRYVGVFKFPPKAGTVTLRTASTLPERRIGPDDATALATIASGVASMALDLYDAKNWIIDGIRLEPNVSGAGEVIGIERGERITLRRLLFVVPEGAMQRRFVLGNGRYITLTQSYCSGIWTSTGQDSQCFNAYNGAGPYEITDNHLQDGSELVMFGGADPATETDIPADIKIEGNLFTRTASWKGLRRGVKNLLELKNAKRVVIRDNVFEKHWADAQSGRAIVFTPRNQNGRAPWTVIEDVVFERNIVRDVPMFLNLLGYDDLGISQQTTGIVIRDNVITTNAGMGILARLELGSVHIYRNTISTPSGTPIIYVEAGDAIRTPDGSRPAGFAIAELAWAENTLLGGYIGSPKVNGITALREYSKTLLMDVPALPEPEPEPEPTKPDPAIVALQAKVDALEKRLEALLAALRAALAGGDK